MYLPASLSRRSSRSERGRISSSISRHSTSSGQPLTTVQDVQAQINTRIPGPTPFGSAGWYVDPKFKNAYSHQWNVEIQQQFTDSLVASIAYVGSRTKRLDSNGLYNTSPTPGPGTPAEVRARRPYPYQTTMNYSLSRGQAWYDSLQMKVNRRFRQGLQFLVSYTWSKSIDEGASGWFAAENGASQGNAALQNFYDPRSSRGPSGYDVPHFFP